MTIVRDLWKISSLQKIPVPAEFLFLVPANSGYAGTAFYGFGASLVIADTDQS